MVRKRPLLPFKPRQKNPSFGSRVLLQPYPCLQRVDYAPAGIRVRNAPGFYGPQKSHRKGYVMKTSCKCPKCSAEMEEGFIIEHRKAVRWIAGKPAPFFLGDVRAGGEQRRIESCRCVACGYVEFYARA